MPSNMIRSKACLRARGLFGLSKDLGPKRHSNTWRKDESKEVKYSMKVEEGGVHCKRYDGCYTNQWVKIPKAI
jgi:hypothetical protein